MGQPTLARHVTVAGVTYGPGDDVPANIAEQITNPKAWRAADEAPGPDPNEGKGGGTDSGHRLATTVTVGGKSYSPADYLPDDVAAQIGNPRAWEGGKLPSDASPAEDGDKSPKKTPAKVRTT